FYALLSPTDRSRLIKTLQDAGIFKYLEAIVAASNPGPSGTSGPPAATATTSANNAASNDAPQNQLLTALVRLWTAAHPKDTGFQLPDMRAPVYPDFVNYDVHPEWLIPTPLRQEEETKARRPIDDLALAQQSGSMLRAKMEQFQTGTDPSVQIWLQAL